jgi:ElaB/YqjD/DUF883 family membrane-anchored ribosome-binding protein
MAELNKTLATPSDMERRDVIDSVKDRAREMATGAERMAGAAKGMAKDVTEAAKEKVSDATSAAGDLAVHVKDKVRDWTESGAEHARDAVQNAGKEVTSLIRRYPIQSLLVGVAAGFVLARATMRS